MRILVSWKFTKENSTREIRKRGISKITKRYRALSTLLPVITAVAASIKTMQSADYAAIGKLVRLIGFGTAP